ncbi:MAG: hypothetical protein HN509_04695 [Halobacteriovoraceae bacterium]|jgi:hypothetical protein|nr:hypothetical protein [Halobacteriovoraceae bacterium]MBT5094320.1 hypothetical protein [Halobacteriovoraceae bacterium]
MDLNETKLSCDNWTFCHFKSLQLKAFICIGGEPDTDHPIYSVTTTDEDEQEFFQKDFDQLQSAVEFINGRYGAWEFVDAQNKSGCDSCSND